MENVINTGLKLSKNNTGIFVGELVVRIMGMLVLKNSMIKMVKEHVENIFMKWKIGLMNDT